MSEQDFSIIEGNQYRGSKYANFAGAGVDTQGNVSLASNENATNLNTGRTNPVAPVNAPSSGLTSRAGEAVPASGPLKVPTAKSGILSTAIPYAGSNIGGTIGANVASGAGIGESVNNAVSGFANKVSGGLIGSPAASTPTNAALAAMGGKFGPATPAAVARATTGSTIGSSLGVGFGSAIATLLTGGTAKDAAKSGIGSGVGYALGNLILPGIGGPIGSLLGSFASGLFGNKIPRANLSANLGVNDSGRLVTGKVSNKGVDNATASKYANQINSVINRFADATQLRLKSGLSTETNIGSEDRKTAIWQNKNLVNVSGNAGDVGAVALRYLKNPKNYDMGGDSEYNTFLQQSIAKARSFNDLVSTVGDRRTKNTAIPQGRTGADKRLSFYA